MSKATESILRPFTAVYRDSDIRIRKKARLLAPTALSIGLFSLVLCGLMAATGAYVVAAVLVGLTAFCAAVLILIARGRFSMASSLFLYGLFAVMFAAIKFDEYRTVYECYVFGTLGSFLLVTSALIAVSGAQVLALTALDLAAIVLLYVADALPLDGGKVTALAAQSLGTSMLLVTVGGVFSSMAVRLQRILVNECIQSSTLARRQCESTTRAVQQAQEDALQISERLAEASESLARAARELSAIAAEESAGAASLDQALAAAAASHAVVATGQRQVDAALGAYSARVLDASAAVSQMIRSLRDIAAAADERRAGIEDLAGIARDGDERVAEVRDSIEGIVKATARMDEMNELIAGVADRTNLLAMNAAIEAAHAGAAGKGFSVVAEEIRRLSEETAEGSRGIAGLLGDARDAVAQASAAGAATGVFFGRMSDEIQRVSATLGELLVRLGEVSSGTENVSGAIGGFRDLSESAGQAAGSASRAMEESSERAAAAREVAARLKAGSERVSSACGELLLHAEAIRGLGGENAARMAALRNSISGQSAADLEPVA